MSGITARYGGVTDSGWFYRFDFHSVEVHITGSPLDIEYFDELQQQRSSFRIDGSPGENQNLSVSGSHYNGESKEIVQLPFRSHVIPEIGIQRNSVNSYGSWLKGDWEIEESATSSFSISSYLESKSRDFSLGEFSQNLFSLQLQRRKLCADQHDVIWGLGARLSEIPLEQRGDIIISLDNDDEYNIFEFFIQDEISLGGPLSLTISSKQEKSQYVDSLEVQPSIRNSWRPSESTTFWASVSEASRTPSVGERGLRITSLLIIPALSQENPGPIPVIVIIDGSEDFGFEELRAFELGIKGRIY